MMCIVVGGTLLMGKLKNRILIASLIGRISNCCGSTNRSVYRTGLSIPGWQGRNYTSSESFLQYIVGYMKQYPNYIILISTHADKHPTRDESQILSDQRALAIIKYLTSNGVSRDRLQYKAYGHDIVVNMDNLPTLKYMKQRMPVSVEFRLIGFRK